MKVIIRKAIKKDAGSILKLIKELALFEGEADEVILTKESIERDGFGREKLFNCFIAEYDFKVVGIALFYPRYSTWKGPTLHLEDLIVTESMKGRGIGKQLYDAFISFAISKGVKRVEWVVLDWNKSAIKFYKKRGAKILKDWRTVQLKIND
tara:strand:+ start:270 stop:725 length:456 start_codon:yes stop_codon:yes gene_type:complete